MTRLISLKKSKVPKTIPLKICLPSMITRLVCFLLITRDTMRTGLSESEKIGIWKSSQAAEFPKLHLIQTMGTFFKRHHGLVLSSKCMNRRKKMINGNGPGNQVSLIHWNMGPRYWTRKTHEIEAATQQYSPDIFTNSEANLLHGLTDYEKTIRGYQLFLPPVPANQKIARLALLLKEGVTADVQQYLMHPALAAVWIKIGARGKKPMLIGMIYREHRYILAEQGDDSNSPTKQYERWKLFVNSWK